MDEQVAVRFTQQEWLMMSVENKKDRNGFVSVTIVKPKDAKPGTEATLPVEVIKMIDAAMADVPADKKAIRRAEMVEAHIKARSSLNGAGERY